jgi:hypothetical protein
MKHFACALVLLAVWLAQADAFSPEVCGDNSPLATDSAAQAVRRTLDDEAERLALIPGPELTDAVAAARQRLYVGLGPQAMNDREVYLSRQFCLRTIASPTLPEVAQVEALAAYVNAVMPKPVIHLGFCLRTFSRDGRRSWMLPIWAPC